MSTPEQADAGQAVADAAAALAAAQEALIVAVHAADRVGVPRATLAELAEVTRPTVYRWLATPAAGDTVVVDDLLRQAVRALGGDPDASDMPLRDQVLGLDPLGSLGMRPRLNEQDTAVVEWAYKLARWPTDATTRVLGE